MPDSVSRNLNNVKSGFEQPAIYLILKRDYCQSYQMISGFMVLYLPYHTILYIQHTDSRIFRTDPDIAFHIFRQFTDTFGIQ